MHPDLYLTIYRQNERELEQRLQHRHAAEERDQGGRSRVHGRRVVRVRHPRKPVLHG